MNIEEIKYRKQSFEDRLMFMINDFEKETKCRIESIKVHEMDEDMEMAIDNKTITVSKSVHVLVTV